MERKTKMDDTNIDYDRLMSDLNDIDSISELDEEQVLELKEKFKQIESKLKDKIKPKTITISGPMHNKIKKYCSEKDLNIGEWVEKILSKEISANIDISVILRNTLNEMCPRIFKDVKGDCLKIELGTHEQIEERDRAELDKKYDYMRGKNKKNDETNRYFKLEIKDRIQYNILFEYIKNVLSYDYIDIKVGKLIDITGDVVRVFTGILDVSEYPFNKKKYINYEPEYYNGVVEFMGFSVIDGMPVFKAKTIQQKDPNDIIYEDKQKMTFNINSSMKSQIQKIFGYSLKDLDFDVCLLSMVGEHIR